MARLLLTTPEGQQIVELGVHNSLGRHPTNSIQLLDKIVSKEHCVIEKRGNQYVLRDLGSLNGTYVNGERVVGERGLAHADEIALGSTRGRFEADATGAVARGQMAPTAQMPAMPASANQAGAGTAPLGSPQWQGGSPPPPAASAPQSGAGQAPQSGASLAGRPAPPRAAMSPAPAPMAVRPTGPSAYHAPLQGGTPPGVPAPAPPTGSFANPAGPGAQPNLRPLNQTRVDVSSANRAIGTQITATQKGFLPYEQVKTNQAQLAGDYERLRLTHELSREIALERDLSSLLNKILISVFRFVRADRGVIFLMDESGELVPGASLRRDGSEAPITVSSTIMNHVIKERATVLTHDAAMDFAGSKGKSMILNRISSAIVAPLLHNDDILGVLWLDSETLAQFQAKDLETLTAIAAQAAMFIEINILGKKVEQEIVTRERFSRLLSPNVAEKVVSGEMVIARGGQLVHECTVFNSDIRGFTQMSEGADPQAIVEMLNEYFELMVETIFKFDGTLDKFMGDGIMALWGAPVETPDDAERCVQCALEQRSALEGFNSERLARGAAGLAIGIGIHTGPLVAGYIGSSKALSYTVIGDTANTSARLCGIAAPGQIIVSEATLAKLGGRYRYVELAPAQLKGKERPFRNFQIEGRQEQVQVPAALRPG